MFLSRLSAALRLSAVRLTASLLLVLSVVIILAGAATYWLVEREITRLADARLMAMRDATVTAIEAGTALPTPGFGQDILVRSGDGSEIASGDTLPFPIPAVADGVHVLDLDDTDYRYLVHTTPDRRRIVIAENTERQDEMLGHVEWRAPALGPRGACRRSSLRALVRMQGQRRLGLISDGLASVAEGDLATRITLPGPKAISACSPTGSTRRRRGSSNRWSNCAPRPPTLRTISARRSPGCGRASKRV